jgi:hypothetical protein
VAAAAAEAAVEVQWLEGAAHHTVSKAAASSKSPDTFPGGIDMRASLAAALLIVMAIYIITAVATEVFVDDFLHPRSMYAYLLVSTAVATLAARAVAVDIPD